MKPSDFATKYANQQSNWFNTKICKKYRIRIVSEFYDYEKAPFKEGDNPRTVFLCRVIDREDSQLKPYEMPISVMKRFAALATDDDWKFESIPGYDITITKTSTGPLAQNVEYQISPCAPTELTIDEQGAVLAADDISKLGERLKNKEAEKMGVVVVSNAPVSEEIPPPTDEEMTF